MTNIFVDLPVPTSNGVGAAVDTSLLGATRTMIVGGPFQGSVTLEYSNDAAAAVWAQVPSGTFVNNPGRVTMNLVSKWMRARMEAYKSGSANADVGASDVPGAGTFAALTPAPTDISGMPRFKTVVAAGACSVEISEDGVSWSQVLGFQQQGGQNAVFIARFARSIGALAWMGATDLEEDADVPFPTPFPVPEVINTIYVRTTGDDATGNGTLAKPFRTIQHAVLQVPLIVPRGNRWIIDDTGITEVFPDNYMFPAWVCAEMVERDISEQYFAYHGVVALRATPQLVAAIPPADAVVALADILSVVANPKSKLITITLNVPRVSWGTDLRGKFAIGAANPLEHCVIGKSTTTTLELSCTALPTTPFQIMEPSAFLSGDNTEQLNGALNVANCGSIEFSGQRIVSNSGGYGLYTTGVGFQIVQLCELEGPNCELGGVSGVYGRLIRSWVKFFCFVTGYFFFRNELFDQCFFNSPIADAPASPEITNVIFDGCDPVEVNRFPESVALPAATPLIKLLNVLIRNGTGDGMKFHGTCGRLENVDIYGCAAGNGITADMGAGLLDLINVGTTGPANSGVGVRVNDGLQVKVDTATSTPLSGTGDSFAQAGTVTTLTDAAALFTPDLVNTTIVIAGATSPANSGPFLITEVVDASNIKYTNPAGVAEVFPGTWTMQPLTGAKDMKVGSLLERSWADFTTTAPINNEYDLTTPFVAASSGAIQPVGDEATGAGTGGRSGSRLFSRT